MLRSSGRPFFARTTDLWRGLFTSAESHGEQYRQPEEEDAIFEDRDGGFSDAVRTQVLDAALAQVAKYGWTVEALSLAAAEQGLSNLAHGLFRRGPVELVEHFIAKCNARMLEELSALDMEHMTLKEKIRAAIHARLRQYAPHIATWPQAIAILAQPSNASTSFSLMFNTINDIIYVAGDSTIDFDWYTKRAVLAGVYTSTELFMLTDASDNFADTWAFLNRRLEDVVTLSKYKAECETLTSLALGYLNAVVQKQHAAPTGESPFHHSPPPHGTPPPPPPAGPAGPFTPSPHDDSIPPRA